jgi:Cu(I)/Ag(I) efflux system membrane protein CusA/SilA
MARAQERLTQVVPVTLAVIFLLLYLTFRRGGEAVLVMLSLPFSLVGGFWLIYLLDYNLSVAVAVGFIALAGVAAEFGVIMLVYLDNALDQWREEGRLRTIDDLKAAIEEGAVLRIRPKAMTVATIFAGLLPIMLIDGVGSEVMRRIAAPMVGGMITAPLLSLFVIPAIYLLWRQRELTAAPASGAAPTVEVPAS